VGFGQLLADLIRFQVKLVVDAVRDVLLVPIAFAAAGIDALLMRWRAPSLFYRVLQIGERSERLIDLWSIVYQRVGPAPERVDAVLDQVEAAVRDPAYGKHRAMVLKRWLARRWRQHAAKTSAPDSRPPAAP
jgi:hypothetical protein